MNWLSTVKTKGTALFASSCALLALALLSPGVVMAQVDVSAATTSIAEGGTAVVTIMTAFLAAFGLIIGIAMAVAAVRNKAR